MGSGAEALLETVELDLQLHGQLVAELREPFLDLRDLGLPLLDVDGERLLELRVRQAEAVDVERLGRRDVADGRLDRGGLALDALDDPLEDAAVLAEARPQEAAVLVTTEPVDVEDRRQLGCVGVLAHVDPVLESRRRCSR